MANKSKKNNSKATQNTEEVVETPVVETPVAEDVVTPEVTQGPGEPVSADVNPEGVAIEPSTKTTENVEVTVDTPAPEGTIVNKSTPDANPVTLASASSNSDKYSDDEDKPDTPPDPPAPAEPPAEPVVNEVSEIVDRDLMRKELGTSYNVKFSYSQASRRFAVNRKMTLLAMYDIFVKNRQAFVGLKSQDDFNHISDFMAKYSVLYNYREIPKAGKEQFLEKLRAATDFVVFGK